jgi:predicted DNA-binding helix-hairpin-helix protein
MDVIDKLKILSEDSQYDLACACGTGKDDRRKRSEDGKWIYPITLPNGGYSVLLKTLLSNVCTSDCKYCPLRSENSVKRCILTPDEISRTFMEYYKARKVFGLFLSSGIIDTPDYTMDKLIASASLVRKKYSFKGYIHLKVIPGASDASMEEAMSLSNAVSLNIETPGKNYFNKLSHRKDFDRDIVRSLKYLSGLAKGKYPKVKLTTQFIVGASDEPDSEILKYSFGLYERLNFNRIYFSAYQESPPHTSCSETFSLDGSPASNDKLVREHRLYQSDFLIRKYGFKKEDFFYDTKGNLNLEKDPKEIWAELNPKTFPVNINSAPKELLLRVPGIGTEIASRITKYRQIHRVKELVSLGVKGKAECKIKKYVVF